MLSQRPKVTPKKVPNPSKPKKTKLEYIPEDCEVNIDSDEEFETES